MVASLGGSMEKAFIAGITTLGDTHGPVSQARRVLFAEENGRVEEHLGAGGLIPGWGNSFFKGPDGDPAWKAVRQHLQTHHPEKWDVVDDVTHRIHRVTGRELAPNAAAYTAVASDILEAPWGGEVALVVEARIPTWARKYHEAYRPSRLLGG